ncbi:hypothetical protein [Natronorubrum daqingense]|nr:hypothetical protein [Natronorubrum daqingense]APX98741.1 hypothetical protein BB347_18725 [Natronorubrum daqingense]
MSTETTSRQKRTDYNQPESGIELIDESTIRSLEDQDSDEDGCRFAAVAKTHELATGANSTIKLPVTVVAYVDGSGEYAVESEFFGYLEDWEYIPRTIVVTDDSVVRELPDAHKARYAPILESYERVLSEDE